MNSNSKSSAAAVQLPAPLAGRIRGRLQRLYHERADDCFRRLRGLLQGRNIPQSDPAWSERDVVLITYGDQVRRGSGAALPALEEFLMSHRLEQLINTVHILPFFPYSSDDGFAVIDYRQVDGRVGQWSDVRALAEHFGLMFDLVLNHCSQQSSWFQAFLRGEEPYVRFFHVVDPAADLSQVTRPRSLPLLTRFDTRRGPRQVWTTFSADQVDLNFAEPEVLLEFVDILLFFASQGARVIRLDAIAYLWKEIGTSCIHLPQTHEVVKLMRDVLEAAAPHVLLITETNVPHPENVSYFGEGDEAHLVYQFSLPPLLLDAFLSGDARPLAAWHAGLDATPPGTTFFNFTASHDGVGVRPLEGLVDAGRFERLVEAARDRGGRVGTKRNPDGTDTPYELNISYVDALGEPDGIAPDLHARRFLSSQAVMLALPGIPGVYFHSLIGTQNDYEGVESSGIPRRINRRKYELNELEATLGRTNSLQAKIFSGYQSLLRTRIAQPAFHPEAACRAYPLSDPALFAFTRTSLDEAQHLLCVTNVGGESRIMELAQSGRELLTDSRFDSGAVTLAPYQSAWFELPSS
jgi:sucrose phosphorylase